MRNRLIQFAALLALVAVIGLWPGHGTGRRRRGNRPSLSSIGPLTFAPDGTLYAADPQAATIFALDLGASASGGAPGHGERRRPRSEDRGDARHRRKEIADHRSRRPPARRTTRSSSVMRGQGANAKPALLRVDGAGKIDLVAAESLKCDQRDAAESAGRERRPGATTAASRSPSWRSRTAASGSPACRTRSSRRSSGRSPYPFTKADAGTSVEIYHGNHQQLETALAGLRVHPVHDQQPAVHHRRVSLHAAGEVPGVVARRPARSSAARRSPSSAPATGRST